MPRPNEVFTDGTTKEQHADHPDALMSPIARSALMGAIITSRNNELASQLAGDMEYARDITFEIPTMNFCALDLLKDAREQTQLPKFNYPVGIENAGKDSRANMYAQEVLRIDQNAPDAQKQLDTWLEQTKEQMDLQLHHVYGAELTKEQIVEEVAKNSKAGGDQCVKSHETASSKEETYDRIVQDLITAELTRRFWQESAGSLDNGKQN